ncbi:MAG: 50S ribosomal protein L28 [Lachnospiraceae bacterium]|nr:50S ribosomal protein L28 [Candidatus Hippenecus merdae]MCQ2414922.1 50S ribosomal protein L28 [Lachnospiraceae bacterium]
MAKCSVCGKSAHFGNKVSHSHRRSNKMWKPNVKKVNVATEAGNKRIYVCTSCLRSGNVQRAEIKTAAVEVAD